MLNFGFVGDIQGSAAEEGRTRRFGVFELDLKAGELRRNGMKIKLQDQPFQVLAQLLEKPGDIVTREDLRKRLWPADTFVDFDHSLNAAVKRLRDALGDSAENPRFVETVARRGYRFLAPVSTSVENGNGAPALRPSIPETPSSEQAARPAVPPYLWWAIAAAGVALVLLGLKLGLSLGRHPPFSPSSQNRISRLTANPADDRVRAGAISRDGKYVAFSDETGFYLRQIDTGETYAVTLPAGLTAASISWFPDSTHMIVALAGYGPASSLWEISALGGSVRKLSDDGRAPAVSPDGRQIAFITGQWMREQIWLMAADGSDPGKLLGSDGDSFGPLAWSPDGTKIAYIRGRVAYSFGVPGAIELVDIRNQHVGRLLEVSSTTHWFARLEGPLAWSPDGRLIYALAEPPPRQLDSNLWSIALDSDGHVSGAPSRLTSDAGVVLSISTSGDGKRVAYLRGVPQPDVYVARVEGEDAIREPRRLTLDDRQDLPFDWSADGKQVLFVSDRTGTFNIYRQAIDQTVPELLVGGTRPLLAPRLSPDGTQLLYLAFPGWSDNFTMTSLMRLPLAGGAPQRLVEANLISNQQCARAPATLCLYSVMVRGEFTLFSFDPLEGNATQVYQIKDNLPLYNWSLSPDGTKLAIVKGKLGDDRIHLIALGTGREKWLAIRGVPGIATLDWAADGKSLWATSTGEENALLKIDLQGRTRTVWKPKKLSIYWAIPSRDGRYLALHVGSSSANVWMMERP